MVKKHKFQSPSPKTPRSRARNKQVNKAKPGTNNQHRIESNVKVSSDIELFLDNVKKLNTKNKLLAITGTNGKSTTAKILYEALVDQKRDARLIGNIGNPALSEKKNFKKNIFCD